MSDTGLTVPDMTELPCRYDVTITVDRDSGDHPDPAEFAVAAGQAALARAASIVSAHTASQIIGIVTVLAADHPAAVALGAGLFTAATLVYTATWRGRAVVVHVSSLYQESQAARPHRLLQARRLARSADESSSMTACCRVSVARTGTTDFTFAAVFRLSASQA
jgi:hypothetical protein